MFDYLNNYETELINFISDDNWVNNTQLTQSNSANERLLIVTTHLQSKLTQPNTKLVLQPKFNSCDIKALNIFYENK